MKVLYIFCDIYNRRRSFALLTTQTENLHVWFSEIRNNSRIIWGSPWRQYKSKNPGQIIIRGNDTDIFIISLENVQKLSQSHLWFNTGLDSDNSRSYVDISKLSKELNYGKTLPWIYAYTGTDYSPWVYRKREVRPLLLMIKRPLCLCICGFGQLRSIRKYINDIEKFTCHMCGYSLNKCISHMSMMC